MCVYAHTHIQVYTDTLTSVVRVNTSIHTDLVLRNGLQPTKDRLRTGATCANVEATVEFWNWFYTSELASRISKRNYFVPLPDLVRANCHL